MPARQDTRHEAARVRRLSPLQPLEDQSLGWGIRCHSCTWREGLAPSWKAELRGSSFTSRSAWKPEFPFDQRVALQFLRNFSQLTAFEQAEMILYAALDPAIASQARKGDFVQCLDHFDLLQSPMCDPVAERR